MLSIFGRKAREQTFKERVQCFWGWYREVSPRFLQAINAGQCPSLADEVSSKVDEWLPGLAWEFGAGAAPLCHAFTLSGEGNLHRQLLAQYCRSQAPELPGWTFYDFRQATVLQDAVLEIDGGRFDPLQFWLTPKTNHDEEKLDLTVWHPRFPQMEERARWTVLFLFLDQVLGEHGTGQWIGEIILNDQRLADAMPLKELPDHLALVAAETGWKKLPPGVAAFGYSQEPHDRFVRGDIIAGSTMNVRLLEEYLSTEGKMKNPLAGTGAEYVYVSFPVSHLPDGGEAHARGAIEDALDEALLRSASGRLLGGATGTQRAYIDLLLFDGDASIALVAGELRRLGLPKGTALNYFAMEKRRERITI